MNVQGLGDEILDLIDYVVSRVTWLIASTHAAASMTPAEREALSRQTAGSAKPATELSSDPDKGEAQRQMETWKFDLAFNTAISCVTILRYLTDNINKISFSAMSRLVDKHDIAVLVVPLIENPPWVRKRTAPDAKTGKKRVVWEKYSRQWDEVAAADLMKLTPLEGQPWLCLYNLLQEPEVRKIYQITPYRQSVLQRARKYINEVLVDQLPLLAEVQRTLDEMAIMKPPDATSSGKGALLLEAVAAIQDNLIVGANERIGSGRSSLDVAPVANWMLDHIFVDRKTSSDAASPADITKMADVYNTDAWMDAALGEAKCYKCGAGATKRCSRCKNVWYCSRECQVSDWSVHKPLCDLVCGK